MPGRLAPEYAVETFFSALTRQRIRRGSFHSIVSLQAAINQYLDQRNAEPRPFVWTASAAYSADRLLRSNESAHQTCQMQNLTASWDLQQGGRSTAP
jgi:hypothetical protein